MNGMTLIANINPFILLSEYIMLRKRLQYIFQIFYFIQTIKRDKKIASACSLK